MPPGTGDATLSLAQIAPVSGVLTVVMPQDVSMAVARRGMEAFRQLRVPLLGVVENMSYFIGADGKRYDIFGQGGGKKLARDVGVPLLGEIPIDQRVAECSDAGEPIVMRYPDSPAAKAYQDLAKTVKSQLEKAGGAELPQVQM
jgi:ATP-binding protein involved in chromosome partitioning